MNWMPPDIPAPAPTATLAPVKSPAFVPPAAPAVSSSLAGTLQGFLLASAVFAAVSVIGALVGRATYGDFVAAGDGSVATQRRLREEWIDADATTSAMMAFALLCWMVVVILLMIWTRRLHRISTTLWDGKRRWSIGWAVGGWFVPLANFVIPKLVLSEIERILSCRRSDGTADPRWKEHTTSAAGWSWWALCATGLFLLVIQPNDSLDLEELTPPEVRAYYVAHVIVMACWCASCVFGVLYVRRLTATARSAGRRIAGSSHPTAPATLTPRPRLAERA
jgi:hypothetical protein